MSRVAWGPKKYKKCHLGRDEQEALHPWEADKGMRRYFGAKRCVAPTSLPPHAPVISFAHTVLKSGSLKQIARDGHVYGFVPRARGLGEVGRKARR